MEKKVYIQIYRIIAMFLIITCHICEESSNGLIVSLGQAFNVGVFCFLFISGYLYSNKKIENSRKWCIKRLKKILLPMYIFMIILSIVNIVRKDFNVFITLGYLFNLQYYTGYVTGGGHLWFLTIIMICYLLLPLVKKIDKKNNINWILISTLLFAILLANVSYKMSFTFMYIFSFLSGYKFCHIEDQKNINTIKSMLMIFLAITIRLLSKRLLDGTMIYDIIIFSLTHLLLALGIYCLVKSIINKVQLKSNKLINHIDGLSMYIYISHNIFISKPLEMLKLTNIYILNLLLALLSTYILAIIIKSIDDYIQKKEKGSVI